MKQKKLFKALLGILFLTLGITTTTDVKDVKAAGTDTLTATGLDLKSSYSDFTGKTLSSGAVYAGNAMISSSNGGAIQIKSRNSNSGIVTTASGGVAKKISVVWHSDTLNGRTLDVYGKNTAYTAATDLYNTTSRGEKVGSIIKGTSTELSFSSKYEYIGLRSSSGAMYLTSIGIEYANATEASLTIASSTNNYIDVANTLTFTQTIENVDASTQVTYESSNTDVATFNGNVLTANKVGTTTVTASMIVDGTKHTSNSISITVWPEAESTLSIETANSMLTYLTAGAKTPYKYYVSGSIKEITNASDGSCVITDGTNDLSIYKLYDSTGDVTYDNMTNKPSVGDTCKLFGVLQNYNGSLQMSNAWINEHTLLKNVYFTTSVELGFSTEYTISDEVTTATWTKVTDASTLSANDKIIIVNETKAKVAGDITSDYMNVVDNTFVSGTIPTPSANNAILTLDGTSTAWTLKNESNNLLGATAVKKLAWDNGTTTWTISIDSDGNATIQNTNDSYGRFLYNDSDPRFTTYTSSTTTSMLLPQIYKLSDKATYNFSSFSNYHLRFSTSVSESDVSRILNEGETPSDLTYGLLVTPKSYMETSDYATFEEAYQSNSDIDFEYEFMAKNVTTTLDENGGFGVILNNIPNATVEISIVLYAKDSAGNMYFAEQKTVSIKSVVTAYYNRLDTLNLTEAQAEAVKALYKSLTTNA